jgi:hypothetical protein
VPGIEEMRATCGRLVAELNQGTADHHRLLEIETIVRLLVPHLIRAVAERVQRDGPLDGLRTGAVALVDMEDRLMWVRTGKSETDSQVREALLRITEDAHVVLEALEVAT